MEHVELYSILCIGRYLLVVVKGGGEVINGNGGRESGWKERDKEKREV